MASVLPTPTTVPGMNLCALARIRHDWQFVVSVNTSPVSVHHHVRHGADARTRGFHSNLSLPASGAGWPGWPDAAVATGGLCSGGVADADTCTGYWSGASSGLPGWRDFQYGQLHGAGRLGTLRDAHSGQQSSGGGQYSAYSGIGVPGFWGRLSGD